jgi:hypothetical protein
VEKTSQIGRVPAIAGVLLVLAVAISVLAAPRAQAEDKPFEIAFDRHQVQIGVIPDLPIGATSSGGSITGTVDENGNVTIPARNFVFPVYGISEPVSLSAYMATNKPVTGTWDEATGRLELDAETGIFLRVNVTQLLGALEGFGVSLGDLSGLGPILGLIGNNLSCGFSPIDVTFSTENERGARFTRGTAGPGAISAEWSRLGSFAGQPGAGLSSLACPMIKSMLPELLSGLGGSAGLPIDLGDLNLSSLLDNLDNLDLGPSSLTLTRSIDESRPVIEEPPIGEPVVKTPKLKLSVTPKKRKVRAGRKVVFTAKVRNAGDGPAERVEVCLRAPGRKVLGGKRCRFLGKVPAGSTRTRKVAVKVKRGQRKKRKAYKVAFELRAANATRSKSTMRLLVNR